MSKECELREKHKIIRCDIGNCETCEKCHWITDYNILKIHENEVIKLCEQEVKQARKKTAMEILKEIRGYYPVDLEYCDKGEAFILELCYELANKYGVELENEQRKSERD